MHYKDFLSFDFSGKHYKFLNKEYIYPKKYNVNNETVYTFFKLR